ncbi:CoA transferase [Amylibacter sp. IMCC11727]|uniref:CaiB/BaiF CoA transferase family protein n=1 Tax=Amylibacter sp. IMCC11727 TaxID=3039851 RepID=UPI00244DD8CC|nr:CoA transferase [Amylibacter sp. IMCC11727]WGI21409.1 CoA transferase [Amylibacter sp. IMCC11727]
MTSLFEGIRILDLTSMISGPTTTMILADQGADVIKIETPETGDHTRMVSTRRAGMSASFVNNNRNKRSLTLNLKDDRCLAAFQALVKTADVIVQNFRPGVADRIGVGETACRALKDDIIYVSISGFGETGPYAQKPVYDPLVQALSGLTTVQAGSDQNRPRLVRTILPDKLTGFAASQAISAALFHRERTGTGQHIQLSMLDTVISFLWGSDMGGHTFVGNEFTQENAQSFIDLIYETADGYISVAVQSNKEWANLSRAFDMPELVDDPRFKTAALRGKNIDERLNLTQEVLRTRTTEDWLARLEAEDVPCAPVLHRREMRVHPQVQANDTIMEYEHPTAGRLRQARPAPRFSETPTSVRIPPPALGEHTAELLAEAGLSQTDIATLAAEGLIKLGDSA